MKVLHARNVNDALRAGRAMLTGPLAIVRSSRVGETLEWPEAVATVYHRPQERVLWSVARAANPFFHFFEAMWMLSGGRDVEFPAKLLPRMAEYSDNGDLMQGAYGYRWRECFDYDQFPLLIAELRDKPATRRAVLTMWSPNDLLKTDSLDIPCNTHVYFKRRQGALTMLVCNRSNDMIWGAYGANAVHMAFLQEYIADKVGAAIGAYTQMSDCLHVYTGGPGGKVWDRVRVPTADLGLDFYKEAPDGDRVPVAYMPMRAQETGWDEDMRLFFAQFARGALPNRTEYQSYWWREVCVPLWRAFALRDAEPLQACKAQDWRMAGYRWFNQQKAKGRSK